MTTESQGESIMIPPGARFWDESFRSHEPGWFFGGEPSTLARRLTHFFRLMDLPMTGRLLDLGCGEGRDLVFFSRAGFHVEGLDGAPTAVERSHRALAEAKLSGIVRHGDLTTFSPDGLYEVIFANNSVQFAGTSALAILDSIRRSTRGSGLNAIGMFTREAMDARGRSDVYLLETQELRRLYGDWEILEYGESVTWSPRRGEHVSLANLIARKPHSSSSGSGLRADVPWIRDLPEGAA